MGLSYALELEPGARCLSHFHCRRKVTEGMIASSQSRLWYAGTSRLEEARIRPRPVNSISHASILAYAHPDSYNGFGGKPEPGEDMIRCAQRELEVRSPRSQPFSF